MSDQIEPTDLLWAERVWRELTRVQCEGLLHLALRYDHGQSHTNSYIAEMALLSWPGLGRPLQVDLTRAMLELRRHLER